MIYFLQGVCNEILIGHGRPSVALYICRSYAEQIMPTAAAKAAATANENKVTLKVGYNAQVDIRKWICGYDTCRRKLPQPTVEYPSPIACCNHTETYDAAFSYMELEQAAQTNYNGEVEVSQYFDTVHGVIHNGDDKECSDGFVGNDRKHFRVAARTYGAYAMKGPPPDSTHQSINNKNGKQRLSNKERNHARNKDDGLQR